ncbi:multidrug effflux MFS transporter [Nocardioides humi]|uniref:Multidrug effflux MFS transporter n=1 Tax=Nocardioides humi TaxID=449461 RepID=A0ABN2AIS9_9ACTN|nr:multidrug effflux MFS transporter [Nocardioides humi]
MTAAETPLTGLTTPAGHRTAPVLAVVATLMALAPFSMDMYLPALPRMAADLGTTPSHVQLSLTGMLVGLAVGQLLVGPLADVVGRRTPVLVGLSCHVGASLLCYLAADATVLAGVRVLQGLSCAAVTVVSMATVRDLFAGGDYARVMSRMFLVIGVAPVIAPAAGGIVIAHADWPNVFLVLAALGVALLALALMAFPETLPTSRRAPAGLTATRASYGELLRDRGYLSLILVGGLMFSTLFCYVSGASFLFQDRFGLSEQQSGLMFAANAVGLTVLAQLNPRLIRAFGPARVLIVATSAGVLSAGTLLVLLSADAPFGWVVAALGVSVAGYGLSMPNSQALALARQGHRAGTAAALMGFTQFVIGSAVAPAVGLGGADGVAMAVVMLAATAGAAILMWAVVRRDEGTMAVR